MSIEFESEDEINADSDFMLDPSLVCDWCGRRAETWTGIFTRLDDGTDDIEAAICEKCTRIIEIVARKIIAHRLAGAALPK